MRNIIFSLSVLCLSIGYARAQNPTIESYESNILCLEAYGEQLAIKNIVYHLEPDETVFIVEVNYPSPAFSNAQYNTENNISEVFLETGYEELTGDFDIEIVFALEGDEASYSEIIQVTIADVPNVTISSGYVCESLAEFDLNTLVNLKGGSFSIYAMESTFSDGVIDIQELIEMGQGDNTFGFGYTYVDIYGCEYEFYENEIELIPSPKIELDYVINTVCNDNLGEVYTTVDSPNGSYEGYWNNGTQNSDKIIGLTAGDYYYTVEDTVGCKDQFSAIVYTEGFEIEASVIDVACKDGSNGGVSIDITGGSGNYDIMWSTGHSTANVTGLKPGVYQVKVTDLENVCEAYEVIEISEPDEEFWFGFSTVDSPTTCTSEDGEISSFFQYNGHEPFEYLWNTGKTTDSISNLAAGYYSFEVIDSVGCKAYFNIDLNADGPPYVYKNYLDSKDPVCGEENGEIHIDGFDESTSGIESYLWSNGSTNKNLIGVPKGEYNLEITLDDGCVRSHTFELDNTPFSYKPEVCIVTVDTATNTNLVVWEKEVYNANNIEYYNIYRANASSGQYQLIDTVHYNSMSVYNDLVASPERRSWMYKISAVNNCGQESYLSSHHKTIHLVMTDGGTPKVKRLTWDHYEGLEYFHYDLYRGTNVDGWNLVEGNMAITSLPDFIDTLPAGATQIDYIVEVVPIEGGCSADYGKAQDYNSSRSNKPTPIFDPKGDDDEDDEDDDGDSDVGLVSYENNEFKALIYPNPSNGDFKIKITGNINNQNLKMIVMGISGKAIHQQSLSDDLNTVQLNVDSGMYFVQIKGEDVLETIRVIVQ